MLASNSARISSGGIARFRWRWTNPTGASGSERLATPAALKAWLSSVEPQRPVL